MADTRGRYRKLYMRIWTSDTFQRLTDREKLIALYLLTGPQTNRIGLYRLSIARLCEDLGESNPTLFSTANDDERASQRVIAAFGWKHDTAARVLWIPRWWYYNPPESPNVLTGAVRDLAEVPSTALVGDWVSNLEDFSSAFASHFRKLTKSLRPNMASPFGEGRPLPSPNQEQEHKQEQEQNQEKNTARAPAHQVIDRWVEKWTDAYGEPPKIHWPKLTRLTTERLLPAMADLPAALALVDAYFATKDKFIIEAGHTFELLCSESQINKLIAEQKRGTVTSITRNAKTDGNTAVGQRFLRKHRV